MPLERRTAIVVVIATAIALSPATVAHGQESADLEELRDRALELVNQDRARNGLPALEAGPLLDQAALVHAEDMLERNYYAHVSPEGDTVVDRYAAAGGSRWEFVAENISQCAGCTAGLQTVVNLQRGWMDSPEHRANILAEGLDQFGFAIASGGGTVYAVQTFAGPGTPRGLEPGEETRVVAAGEQTAVLLRAINEARRQAGAAPLTASDTLSGAARSLVPAPSGNFAVEAIGDIGSALPSQERARWARLFAASGACGGCGTEATEADIAFFADDWLRNDAYRESFVSSSFTHIGFALKADGQGKKIALALLGAAR
jgi:uncharacterized protein YkwD